MRHIIYCSSDVLFLLGVPVHQHEGTLLLVRFTVEYVRTLKHWGTLDINKSDLFLLFSFFSLTFFLCASLYQDGNVTTNFCKFDNNNYYHYNGRGYWKRRNPGPVIKFINNFDFFLVFSCHSVMMPSTVNK